MATETQTTSDNTSAAPLANDEADLEAAVRLRAYEISQSPDSGTPEENWERAEREIGPATEDR